ncbi:hypothetical protein WAI453_013335 [Rhynchosporium graminicola]|uniref:Uncharacterized protein n=1 Tax=Rhynchosporium graminicola TaxID=2792576 RepID=A0A1E1K974_9HELO|nr:uncharacterized protein RCO7_06639 [Rhynchosporium commune]
MMLNALFFLPGLLSLTAALTSYELEIPTAVPSSRTIPPSQATVSAQLSSYLAGLATAAPFSSAFSYLAINATASASLSVFEASISSVFANRETLASDYLNGIPGPVRPFFSSVYSVEASILSKNGFATPLTVEPAKSTETGKGSGTGTTGGTGDGGAKGSANGPGKKGAASRETGLGRAGLIAVAGVVGFISLVVAL